MSAQKLGWGAPGLSRTTRVPCAGIPLNVRPDVAPLFAELVRWLTAERARLGRPPLTSSGGYIKRRVRGSLIAWSNHSWGLAADFNAATNPMSVRLKTDMPPGTSAKAKSLGMRWGGDYLGRKDPMHFEVVVSPAEAARIVAGLKTVKPQAASKPKPVPAPKPAPVEDEMTPQDWTKLEKILDDRIRLVLRGQDSKGEPTGHANLLGLTERLDRIEKALGAGTDVPE